MNIFVVLDFLGFSIVCSMNTGLTPIRIVSQVRI